MDTKIVEEFLERLRAEMLEAVTKQLPRLVTPPRVLTMADAARELSVSPSKLKGLVKCGAVATVLVGKVKMVPRSEIERIEASATREGPEKPRTSGGRRAKKAYSVRDELAKLRAAKG